MTTQLDDLLRDVNQLVSENRKQCLWYLREDFFPRSVQEALKVLKQIQRHGDRKTYIQAGKLRRWLLQITSEVSAG